VELELVLVKVFEDTDVPTRQGCVLVVHVHDEHVAVEVVHPGCVLTELAQASEGVEVEDEQSTLA